MNAAEPIVTRHKRPFPVDPYKHEADGKRMCAERHEAYICTRAFGHEGRHVAGGLALHGVIYREWAYK